MTKLPTRTFCIYPWVHGQVDIDGSFVSCCEVPLSASLGNVKEDGLSDIWNGAPLRKLRKTFLAGEIPEQCLSCFMKEELGHESDRLKANALYPDAFSHVEKTSAQG